MENEPDFQTKEEKNEGEQGKEGLISKEAIEDDLELEKDLDNLPI